MSTLHRDRWIECTEDAVLIHGYYFPWGTKRAPYPAIRTVRRVPLGHSSAGSVTGPPVVA